MCLVPCPPWSSLSRVILYDETRGPHRAFPKPKYNNKASKVGRSVSCAAPLSGRFVSSPVVAQLEVRSRVDPVARPVVLLEVAPERRAPRRDAAPLLRQHAILTHHIVVLSIVLFSAPDPPGDDGETPYQDGSTYTTDDAGDGLLGRLGQAGGSGGGVVAAERGCRRVGAVAGRGRNHGLFFGGGRYCCARGGENREAGRAGGDARDKRRGCSGKRSRSLCGTSTGRGSFLEEAPWVLLATSPVREACPELG